MAWTFIAAIYAFQARVPAVSDTYQWWLQHLVHNMTLELAYVASVASVKPGSQYDAGAYVRRLASRTPGNARLDSGSNPAFLGAHLRT